MLHSAVINVAFFADSLPCYTNIDVFRGWHVYAAAGLRRQGFNAIAVNLSNCNEVIVDNVDGVPLIRVPLDIGKVSLVRRLNSIIRKMLGYDLELNNASLTYGDFLDFLVNSIENPILYLHGYHRRTEAWIVMRRIMRRRIPMILQNHASKPPFNLHGRNIVRRSIWYRRENGLRRIPGFFFALSEFEKRYLESLGVRHVMVRTMPTDFNLIKPLNESVKREIRNRHNMREDTIYITMYSGGIERGIHYVPIISEALRRRFGSSVELMVMGSPPRLVEWLRGRGVMAFQRLPYKDYLEVVNASDLFIMPARSETKYGGIMVSVMEAMAAGIPVVSPTLIHFPDIRQVNRLGSLTRFVDSVNDLKSFIDEVIHVIENLESFNPWLIHELGKRHYSWEAFTADFKSAVSRLGT